eukprot:TRINITY_DN47749_c0_g1_i1.p1 TRINITY_DN47749_c0_g1~~TRINITY_DN47749_c0_g1_i1.p1  ORF type:complete len:720 (-),score=99.71 TRINITY_DN47749_c0_g1_i1:14-2173(-)
MGRALREATDVELVVVASAETKRDLRRVTGTVVMRDMVLQTIAKFTAPNASVSDDVEVAAITPQLEAWNHSRRQAGACCTQCVEVGDRIVAVNGHTEVETHLAQKSPILLISRWLPPCSIISHRFDVTLQRSDAKQDWGMQLTVDVENEGVHVVTHLLDMQSPISLWNQKRTKTHDADTLLSCTLLPGDRIISINARKGRDAQLELKRALKVLLKCERFQIREPGVATSGSKLERQGDLECSRSATNEQLASDAHSFELNYDELDTSAGAAQMQQSAIPVGADRMRPSGTGADHSVCPPSEVIQDSQPELCIEPNELEAHRTPESSRWDADFNFDDLEVSAATACIQQHAEQPGVSHSGRCDDQSVCMNLEGDAMRPMHPKVAQDVHPELSIELGELNEDHKCSKEATHKPIESDGWDFDFHLDELDTTVAAECAEPTVPANANGRSHSGRSADFQSCDSVRLVSLQVTKDTQPELSIEPGLGTEAGASPGEHDGKHAQHRILQSRVTANETASDNAARGQDFTELHCFAGADETVNVGPQNLGQPSASTPTDPQDDVTVCLEAGAGLGDVSSHAFPQADLSNCQRSHVSRSVAAPKFHFEAAEVSLAPFDAVDPDGTWLSRSGFVVLAGSGSPAYMASLQDWYAQLRQSGCTAGFYREERLPIGSLLVVQVDKMRCRWFPDPAKTSFPSQLLSDESYSLPIEFDPQNFVARSFGSCLG